MLEKYADRTHFCLESWLLKGTTSTVFFSDKISSNILIYLIQN